MKPPETPDNETERLAALLSLGVLDTDQEERFDRLTRLARRLFAVPIALITLVDSRRQWFKSRQGLDIAETSREISFCGHAILEDGAMAVPDALQDSRFVDNPLVTADPRIRFYAGFPLTTPQGYKVGTLCLIDSEPRELNDEDLALLRDLGRIAEQEFSALALAAVDDLTLLSNRRGFRVLSDHALKLCRRLARPAVLLFFDLDHFKMINDEFGHATGDRALRDFSMLLLGCFRDSDVIGRVGGDEFAILLTGADEVATRDLLERLRLAVEESNRERQEYQLRYSVGMVTFDSDQHASTEDMLPHADAAMYTDKRAKTGR